MKKKDSKTDLLYSAFGEFAKNGFFGAKTRDIAQRANINISSIIYYFGGKKGIYTAALDDIVITVKEMTSNLNIEYDAVAGNKDTIAARNLLQDFIKTFLYLLCSDKISKDMKTVFFSEYSRPTEDFNILYDGLIQPFHKKFATLISLASNETINIKDAYLFTFPIFSQLFVFASRKETICNFMEWEEYSEEQKSMLLNYMLNQIDSLIGYKS